MNQAAHPRTRQLSRLRRHLVLLLIACLLGGILVSILLPSSSGCGHYVHSRKAESGKKMNQIFTAMHAYANDYDRFPLAGQALIRSGMSDADAAKVTALTCEMLAAAMNLPPRLFKCPTAYEDAPPPPRPFTGTDWSGATPGGWEVAASGQPGVSYALDWAVPGNAATKTSQIWISERSPDVWGGEGVMACYGDGHTAFLPGPRGLVEGASMRGNPADPQVIKPDTPSPAHDPIYDDAGDSKPIDDEYWKHRMRGMSAK
jgi:hypothetical protein